MHLGTLNLGSSNLNDAGAQAISHCTSLIQIKAAGTEVTDQGLASLAKLPGLQILDLRNLNITDSGLIKLVTLTHLISLPLNGNHVTANGVRRICQKAKALHNVNLARCPKVSKHDYQNLQSEFPSVKFSDVDRYDDLKNAAEKI